LAREFTEQYSAAVAMLVDLFGRMPECDRENLSAPRGEQRRLQPN
jgi:hypothetical protein